MRLHQLLCGVCLSTLICGCTNVPLSGLPQLSPTIPESQPQKQPVPNPENTSAVLTLEAKGEQIFRCTIDSQGAYYRFERPEATLYNKDGEEVASLSGPMSAFTHKDGSSIISTRIVKWANPPNPDQDIKIALLSAVSDPGDGVFNNVTYIQRLDTAGGMPQKGCTPSEKGHLLKVPFKARFVFWKPTSAE